MENIIIILAVAVAVALAFIYIYKAKKSGKHCIGCPDGCSCKDSTCQGCTKK